MNIDCFRSPDRVEPLEILGRPVRKGSPDELAVSDAARVREALAAGDSGRARGWLEYLRALQGFVLTGSLEWLLRWPAHLSGRFGPEAARELAGRSWRRWRESAGDEADPFLADRLGPEGVLPPALESLEALAVEMSADLEDAHRSILAEIEAGRFDEAAARFDESRAAARRRHDGLLEWIWALSSAVLEKSGREAVEEALEATFGGCSFHEPMWALFGSLPPEALAAVLAEHLRTHFSGPGREGSVRIVEEPDRWRLVLEPCGTGGAMRRRLAGAEGFASLREPGDLTWGRTDGVPLYCAHCALNERTSKMRTGRRLWTTDYDPDPSRPCGWTVPKR